MLGARGKSDRITYEKMYQHTKEPIRVYVQKIYNGNDLSDETKDGVLQSQKKDLHIVFIDFEKAYVMAPKEVL